MLPSDLLQLSTMTLCTTGADGLPHAAPVYFTAIEMPGDVSLSVWSLYFFSEARSQHAHDLTHDGRAAIAIYPECREWQDIRGLQMRGEARQVRPGFEWEIAWEQYRAKFPFVAHLKAVVARNDLYAFTPRWVRLVDNQRGFGFKEEWTLEERGWLSAAP